MRLNRALRMLRWTPAAAIIAGAACQHGDVNSVVTLDGDTIISNIALGTQGSGAAPSVSRTVSFFSLSFDTAFTDAFDRLSAITPGTYPVLPLTACGGRFGDVPIIYPTTSVAPTYTPPARYLPVVVGSASLGDLSGCGQAVGFIVQGAHPANGRGNTVWSFEYDLVGLTPNTRYVMGLARYAVTQRGSLDIPEILLTGAVAQPDTLVFLAGASEGTTRGRKASPAHVTCADANALRPDTLMNPALIASAVSDAQGNLRIDQTACSDGTTAWANGVNLALTNVLNVVVAASPVPNNTTGSLRRHQFNFLVVWEALLADSTPNFDRPVYRQQVGPLVRAARAVVNNSFAPIPTAQLTARQLGPLRGSTSRVDSVTIVASNLAPLANSVYQVWFTKAGTDTAVAATGRVYRLVNNVVVDSITSANSFNGDTASTFRMKIDYAPYAAAGYNSVVLALAPSAGGGTALPAVQPAWTVIQSKVGGQVAPAATLTTTFGFFNNGVTQRFPWNPAGLGRGGAFGRDVSVQVTHLTRPPVGYYYNAYLRSSSTGARLDLGPITSPWPDYTSLRDADAQTGGTVNDVEIVDAAVRYRAQTDTELCVYDRVDVRLEPKDKVAGILAPTIAITGDNPYPKLARCQP